MNGLFVLAFVNFGWTEGIIIGVVALLLFGPRLARTMGQVGGTLLRFKKDVEDTKLGLTQTIERELNSALGPDDDKPRDAKQGSAKPQDEKPGQKKEGEAEVAEEAQAAEEAHGESEAEG